MKSSPGLSRFFTVLIFVTSVYVSPASAQTSYAVDQIDEHLLKNSSAVIRKMDWELELKDFDELVVHRHEVITVLNRGGLKSLSPYAPYDDFTKIKKIEAVLYDENGKELRNFKKKDFSDVSASGTNLYTDNRLLELDLIPPPFPFTFEIKVMYETSSTAHLPEFNPSPSYYVSTESARYELHNPRGLEIRTQEFKLDQFDIQRQDTGHGMRYIATNIEAMIPEPYSPYFTEFSPLVRMVPVKFNLMGETAEVHSWDEFANWQSGTLLSGRSRVSRKTAEEIEALVAGVDDPKHKTRLIYRYMQDKTRYISVQIGLGGFQPVPAMEVDRQGYGDCKGLTNYMQSLLSLQGIPSYYTIVDAGADGQDIDEDFVALQGNHVILTVPFDDEMVFLECTSQKMPYSFIGSHTDDRKVFAITPTGGAFLKTTSYPDQTNRTQLTSTLALDRDLNLRGELARRSEGLAYGSRYELEELSGKDIEQYYREEWGHLNNMEISNIDLDNNRDEISFEENMKLSFSNYVSKAGNMVLLNPNVYSRQTFIPDHQPNRSLDVEIKRGFTYQDRIEIQLPENLKVSSDFETVAIDNEFGSYHAQLTVEKDGVLRYERNVLFRSGTFSSQEYADYRDFIKQIVNADNQKIVLQYP